MKIQLESIRSHDKRAVDQLARGEVVEHEVEVTVDGHRRTFVVYFKANVLPSFDAGLLYGDELLEELLRFEPEALSTLYSAVGKHQRGVLASLPLLLVDGDDADTSARLSG